MRRLISSVHACALACAVFVSTATAERALAQFACGDVVGPGGSVTFTSDIGPCTAAAGSFAFRIIGPIKVDMAGHSVLCVDGNAPGFGIQLEGKGVKIKNGHVLNCAFANLVLGGEGKHIVEQMVAEESPDDGVRVSTGGNKLRRVAANNNDDVGIELTGSGNKLEDVAAVDNDIGVFLSGSQNKLKRVAVVDNVNGIFMQGGGNALQENAFIDNSEDGVDVEGGGNTIQKSTATANGSGIGTDSGIDLRGDGNVVKQNRVLDNFGIGIRAGAAQSNIIQKNSAIGNFGLMIGADLQDDNPGGTCDNNTWSKNVFGTSLAAGMAGPACIQ